MAVPPRRLSIDWSQPIFVLLATLLTILVVLPLGWLGYYSVIDQDRPRSRSPTSQR